MRINNNIMALNAHRQLGTNQANVSKSMEKLSSGLRINRAGDDAAGLAISEKMRGQIRGLLQASRNAQDGISLIQTAEGALSETHSILQRMRELAVQAATDTNTDEDRNEIQKEIDQLAVEVTRIATDTEFNTQKVLNGEYQDKVLHIGANAGQSVDLTIASMTAEELGVAGEPGETAPPPPPPPADTDGITVEGWEGTYTSGTGTVAGFENQTVLMDEDGEIVAVQIGDDWYDVDDVEAGKEPDTLAPKDSAGAPLESRNVFQLDISGTPTTVTQTTGSVAGVDGATVLVDGSDTIVAVWVEDAWYDPGEVSDDGTGVLVADSTATLLEPKEVFQLDGDEVIKDTRPYDGGTGVEAPVLVDSGDAIVAIWVEDAWYAPTDVDDDGTSVILADENATPLDPLEVFQVDVSGTLTPVTQTTETVEDVEATVLVDASDTIVAVLIGDDWYDPTDVEKVEGNDVLVASSGASPLNVSGLGGSGGNGGTPASIEIDTTSSSGNYGDLQDFAIDPESELEGSMSVTVIWNDDENRVDVTLTLPGGIDIVDPLEGVSPGEIKIGDISFTIDAADMPAASGDFIKLMFTATPAVPAPPSGGNENGNGDGDPTPPPPALPTTVSGADVSSQVAADEAIQKIDGAIVAVSAERSRLGAIQNRLEHTIANLGTSAENLQAAESRIRDLDMAQEIMEFTKNNILQQAATAMLAQANVAPQSVLQLLGG